jgi:hypothetical protein
MLGGTAGGWGMGPVKGVEKVLSFEADENVMDEVAEVWVTEVSLSGDHMFHAAGILRGHLLVIAWYLCHHDRPRSPPPPVHPLVIRHPSPASHTLHPSSRH